MAGILTKRGYLTKPYKNEDQFAAYTFQYINNNYEELRNFFFRVPNESSTSKLMRLKLFAMGVVAGIPDYIFMPTIVYNEVWGLELKIPGNTTSKNQDKIIALWNTNNIIVDVCWKSIEVCNSLESRYGLPKYP